MRWVSATDLLVNPNETDLKKQIIFRQIGWMGQFGRFYTMDEDLSEPGNYEAVYLKLEPKD